MQQTTIFSREQSDINHLSIFHNGPLELEENGPNLTTIKAGDTHLSTRVKQFSVTCSPFFTFQPLE